MRNNIENHLVHLVNQLSKLSDTPDLDAQVIIAHAMSKPRTWIIAHPEEQLSSAQLEIIESALEKLKDHLPLPYVLGHWEFFGLELEINSDVLIPRPETELLVEHAIRWLKQIQEYPASSLTEFRAADIGTGSGCISVALAMHIPVLHLLATDISYPALQVARRNAKKFGVEKRLDFIQCDILPPHPSTLPTESHLDLICANLPYIPTETLRKLNIFSREPSLALDGGADGLDLIRRLLKIAPLWLAPGGMILCEIEANQGNAILALVYDTFSQATVHLHQDLAGHDRLLQVHLPAAEQN